MCRAGTQCQRHETGDGLATKLAQIHLVDTFARPLTSHLAFSDEAADVVDTTSSARGPEGGSEPGLALGRCRGPLDMEIIGDLIAIPCA